MKIYNEELQKIKRIKNKTLLQEDISNRIIAILKRQPSMYFNKRLRQLEKVETILNEKFDKVNNALSSIKEIKEKVIKQIDELEIKNNEIKNNLMIKLSNSKQKGKSKGENNRK